MKLAGALAAGGLTLVLAGCSGGQPAQGLTADQFAVRHGVTTEPPDKPIPASPPPKPIAEVGPAPAMVSPEVGGAVSRPYSQENFIPGSPTTREAEVAPASVSPTPGSPNRSDDGVSRTLDVFFVVLDVNGRAVFSDKVLQVLERPLAAEARRLDANAFRKKAQELIERQVRVMANDELEVAVAEKELDQKEKQFAEAKTMEWRQQQITAAGGSLELARRRASQDGWDFDDIVRQHSRLVLVQLLYQRKVVALAQAPAADIRAYYDRNKEKEFSQPGKLKFRVIRLDAGSPKYAGIDEAMAAADKIKARAADEDFAKLAADPQLNDDSVLRSREGYPRDGGWVLAGNYKYEVVEQAMTELRPGAVSGVIVDRKLKQVFVAKLEEVQEAKIQSFDEPQVQEKIANSLKGAQIQQLRERLIRSLESQAVTSRRPGAMEQLLAIVMQRYPEWSKRG